MIEAHDLFNAIFFHYILSFVLISNFREAVSRGFRAASEEMVAGRRAFIAKMLETPAVREFFAKRVDVPPTDLENALAKRTAQLSMKMAEASLDAASIVFTHSVVDALALDRCVITSLLAPSDWQDGL